MAISDANQPQLPNLCVATVNGRYSYLWPYTTKIVNGRLVRTRGKKSVGSIQGGGQTGLVIWKEEFLAQHPELRAYDVYRKALPKGQKSTLEEYQFVFVAKTHSHNFVTGKKEILQAGATWFLDQTITNTPLLRALNKIFNQDHEASKLISLAYYVILSRSLDFNNYVNAVGSIRLPFPNALTERDINLFLKDISDVQIAQFLDELQYRYLQDNSLNKRFYLIEHPYPSNLINKMVDSKVSLYCSNSTLNSAIKKDIQQVIWRKFKVKNKLSTMSYSMDDRVFTVVNSSTGMPIFAKTYNSTNFSLSDILDFCHKHIFLQINKRDFNVKKDSLSLEYLEATTGGFNDIKAKNTSDIMNFLGSFSDNGQIFNLTQFQDNNDKPLSLLHDRSDNTNDNKITNESIYENESLKSTLDESQTKFDEVKASALRSPLSKKLSTTKNNSTTSFSSNLAFSSNLLKDKIEKTSLKMDKKIHTPQTSKLDLINDQQADIVLLAYSQPKLISELSYLCKQKQSFILKLSSNSRVIEQWADHFVNQLLNQSNYHDDNQCFVLNTKLTLSFTDPLSTKLIKDNTGNIAYLPKKIRQTLSLHIKLDLNYLYHKAQQIEESLSRHNDDDEYQESLNDNKPTFWDIDKSIKFNTLESRSSLSSELCEKVLLIKESLSEDCQLTKKDLINLKSICHSLLMLDHNALPIMISNTISDSFDAFHAHDLLIAKERFFDYMSWDRFKLERILFDPITYTMRPQVSQLLRAKDFILFLSSTIYNIIQCDIFKKDQSYGTNKIRNNLGFNNPDEYLKLLNKILAERKKEGFIYNNLSMQQRSLLEYLNLNAPESEGFRNIRSDSQVSLQNYEINNRWLS